MIRIGLVTLTVLMLGAPGRAPAGEDIAIETLRLDDGHYMLVGRGGNIGLSVGEDGVFMIDDQYAPMTPKIRDAISGITEQPVEFVFNTHWHGDHTGGNENFGEGGALIVAHHNVRERMGSEQFMEFFDSRTEPQPDEALPVVTFGDDIEFHINGETVRAFHVNPAHTDGDSVVHFPDANVIHMGDVYFNKRYPFIDLSSGGSIRGVIAAVDRVLPMIDNETRVIPGHGPLSNKAELVEYRDMLVKVADAIERMVGEGKSVGEVQQAAPTAAYDSVWGSGFIGPERWVELVYRDLKRAREVEKD